MEASFQDLIQRLIEEQGIEVLEHSNRCKILLSGYTKGDFRKEIRHFLHSLELHCYQKLRSAPEPEPVKSQLNAQLQDEYMLTPEEAEETLSVFETLVNQQKETDDSVIAGLTQTAQTGDYHAQFALGLLFEKLRRYTDAIYWLKEAAKHHETKAQEVSAPAQNVSSPVKNVPSPAQNVSSPAQNVSSPVKNVSSPAQNVPSPAASGQNTAPKGFVKITGTSFLMGSPDGEAERIENELSHEVTVQDFYMAAYAVTQQEYEAVIDMNPSHFKGPKLPVESVNWYDAVAYCNARSTKEGRSPAYTPKGDIIRWNRSGNGYRLPTEAEWEYACRAGTITPFNTGTVITTDLANYDGTYPYSDCPRGIYREKTTPVGSFPPNSWGLYDMHGNVWEWCWDWFAQYDTRKTYNPAGPVNGTNRVIRGGSWGGGARYLRAAYRCGSSPFARDTYLGFRLVLPCPAET